MSLTDDTSHSVITVVSHTEQRLESLSGFGVLTQLFEQALAAETDVGEEQDFEPTPELIAAEAELLASKSAPAGLREWIARYGAVGARHPYLWTWCRQGVEITTLPCVPADKLDWVCNTKVLGVMFDVLLDDVADRGGSDAFLKQMLSIPTAQQPIDWSSFSPEQQQYAALAVDVWQEIARRVEQYPRYAEFAEILEYDYRQLLNAMSYSHLLNRYPHLVNLAEHDLYLPHNMHMMVSATMDIMSSPDFDAAELGKLREAVWQAQCMGRIGNLVTTWQRELADRDFTSGVFARAIGCGDLSLNDLRHGDFATLQRAIDDGQHEQYFLNRWKQHRRTLLSLRSSLKSVDLCPLVRGLERLICLHLGSRGRK